MNIRNCRRRPDLAPDGSGWQDTLALSRSLSGTVPPSRGRKQRHGRGRGPRRATPRTAPGQAALQPPHGEREALGRRFPGPPRPRGLGRDATATLSQAPTQGSAHRCPLRLRSTPLAPAHAFFDTEASPQRPPRDHARIASLNGADTPSIPTRPSGMAEARGAPPTCPLAGRATDMGDTRVPRPFPRCPPGDFPPGNGHHASHAALRRPGKSFQHVPGW